MSANPSWPSPPPLSGAPSTLAGEPPLSPEAPPLIPAPEPFAIDPEPEPEPSAPAPWQVAASTFHVLVHLDGGDKIEVAAHGDEADARAEATALMRYLRDGRGDWPFVAGRFIRPERIVSVDIDERS